MKPCSNRPGLQVWSALAEKDKARRRSSCHKLLGNLFLEDYSLIHSKYFYSASSSPLLLRGFPDYSIDTLSELTCRSITGNGERRTCPRSLREVVVGFKPATFRTQGTELTTEPPRPINTFHTSVLTIKCSAITVFLLNVS